jgi:hypothetical protein
MSDDNTYTDYDFKYHPGFKEENPIDLLLSRDAYNQFVSNIDPTKGEPLTYDEWVKYIESLGKADKQSLHDAAFVAPLGNTIPVVLGGAARSIGNTIISKAAETLQSGNANIDDIVNAGAEFLKQQTTQKFTTTDTGIGDVGDGGDGGTTTEGYSGGSIYNPTGMSLNIKPVQSSFKTGIVPLYRPKFYLDGREDTSPLLLKIISVYPEITMDSTYKFRPDMETYQYLANKLIASWTNVVTNRVRLNTFTSSILNTAHIIDYFTKISYALSVYYFYASVIAHFRMEENRNEGMIDLYSKMTADDIRKVGILQQVLNEIPISTELNEFMFHLYGNYKQSMLPGAPLLKFTPIKFQNNPSDAYFVALATGEIDACLTALRSKPFRDFQQLLAQAFPTELRNKVYGYSGVPEFDANWLTFWVNAPYMGQNNTSTQRVPGAEDKQAIVRMNLHTDAPDGWIEAASGIWQSDVSKWSAGFGAPKKMILGTNDFATSIDIESEYYDGGSAKYTSAYIYRQDTTSIGTIQDSFWPMSKRENSMVLSGMTYKMHSNGPTTAYQRFGTEAAMPRTIRDTIPITQQFIDFMYDPVNYSPSSSKRQLTAGAELMADTKDDRKPRKRRRNPKEKRHMKGIK